MTNPYRTDIMPTMTIAGKPIDTAPPLRVLVTVLVFVAIVLGVATAVYLLTPVEERPELLIRLGTVLPLTLTGIPGILAWLSGRERGEKLEGKLETIRVQTNGNTHSLIARNASDDDAAFLRVLADRRARGQSDAEILNG